MLNRSPDKNARHVRTVEGRSGKGLLRDPGAELRLGREEDKKGEENKWDENENEKEVLLSPITCRSTCMI